MSEFLPIQTQDDLEHQDDDDILLGYMSGRQGDPEPGSAQSRGFWHGWRNGMVDTGRARIDGAQVALAEDLVRRQRAH